MKHKVLLLFSFLLVFGKIDAQELCLKLYKQEVTKKEKVDEKGRIHDVSSPELLAYLPKDKSDLKYAVLIVPGGSYSYIAISHEGYKSAEWLAKNGIAAFILKYRLPKGNPQVIMEDGKRAMEIIHEQAVNLGIDKNKIGVIGFSAGGHLASAILTGSTSKTHIPSFGILVYPVISMAYSNLQTRENLLGLTAKDEVWRAKYSMDKNVSLNTPPTYLILSSDDQAVSSNNSLSFYKALIGHGVKSEIHIFSEGGHGWWMRDNFKFQEEICLSILRWIRSF